MLQRAAVSPSLQQSSRDTGFPAPVKGLVLNKSLTEGRRDEALVLENFQCLQSTIRPRGGKTRRASIGTGPVTALFALQTGLSGKLFAANSTSIFNISSLDPNTVPAADVTGQTSGSYSSEQITTSGGDYLYVVNGADSAQLYDNTSWQAVTTSSSPIAITGVDSSNLSHVWKYRDRLYFIEENTMNAWALPISSVGGAAIKVDLGGVFANGGALLTGIAWSIEDSGDGVDDKCLFITNQGEVAVYEGSDPSSASTWTRVGVYEVGRPLGRDGLMKAGGDVLVATVEGLVPISEAVRKDRAALSLTSASRRIEPLWRYYVDQSAGAEWSVVKWSEEGLAYVTLPDASLQNLAVNIETGAWSVYTGWDFTVGTVFGDKVYIAGSSAYVWEAESGGSDDGAAYVARYSGAFDDLSVGMRTKHMHLARPSFLGYRSFAYTVSFTFDYATDFPSSGSASSGEPPFSAWDTGTWDKSAWDSGLAVPLNTLKPATFSWKSVPGYGFVVAPQIQITTGGTFEPDVEYVGMDMIYDVGEIVV